MKLRSIERASAAVSRVVRKETDPDIRLGLVHATLVLDAVITFRRNAPNLDSLADSRDALHLLIETLIEEEV